jgi:N-acetyl-anhydromuramyl-L-alanine amidase AmpD
MADGQIAVGTRWTKQIDGGHLAKAEQNAISLGICLVGNFDRQTPSPKQMQQLTALALALLRRCNLPPEAVKTHQQAHRAHTRCPGKNFPTSSWLRELKALRP